MGKFSEQQLYAAEQDTIRMFEKYITLTTKDTVEHVIDILSDDEDDSSDSRYCSSEECYTTEGELLSDDDFGSNGANEDDESLVCSDEDIDDIPDDKEIPQSTIELEILSLKKKEVAMFKIECESLSQIKKEVAKSTVEWESFSPKKKDRQPIEVELKNDLVPVRAYNRRVAIYDMLKQIVLFPLVILKPFRNAASIFSYFFTAIGSMWRLRSIIFGFRSQEPTRVGSNKYRTHTYKDTSMVGPSDKQERIPSANGEEIAVETSNRFSALSIESSRLSLSDEEIDELVRRLKITGDKINIDLGNSMQVDLINLFLSQGSGLTYGGFSAHMKKTYGSDRTWDDLMLLMSVSERVLKGLQSGKDKASMYLTQFMASEFKTTVAEKVQKQRRRRDTRENRRERRRRRRRRQNKRRKNR